MIKFYSTNWCGACRDAKQVLQEAQVEFTEIDIDQDHEAAEFVRGVNRGMYSVPTIVFPDGSMLTEPSYAELKLKLKDN
ncbi:MAG: glutaredoxin domain-containing protein [Actinomycetota bacterium]